MNNWYEPGEDSYALYDVLTAEHIKDAIIIDLGSSTGFLTSLLEVDNLVLSIDLNTAALLQMSSKHTIRTDLLNGINQNKIDVVVFNPPYVPDFDCPILGGGSNGRETINRFIEVIKVPLFYLLIIEANKPNEVIELITNKGYRVAIMLVKRVVGETIIVLKATK